MTPAQFEREIARLLRRVVLLRAARDGDVQLRRVPVAAHWVKRYWVGEHHRLVGPRRGRR